MEPLVNEPNQMENKSGYTG